VSVICAEKTEKPPGFPDGFRAFFRRFKVYVGAPGSRWAEVLPVSVVTSKLCLTSQAYPCIGAHERAPMPARASVRGVIVRIIGVGTSFLAADPGRTGKEIMHGVSASTGYSAQAG